MLIRQTLRYLPAQVLSPVVQLVSMVVWTYWLPPHEMGSYVLVTATQEFVGLLSLSWFSIYALRFMPFERGKRERLDYLHTEAGIVALSLPLSVAAAALSIAVFGAGSFDLPSVAAVALFFASRGIGTQYSERARAQSNIAAYTILQVAAPALGLAFGLALFQYVAPSANALLAAFGMAQTVAALVAAPMIGVAIIPRRIQVSLVRSALAYGGPVLMLFGLGWIAENNFRYVVEHISGAAVFGLMAVGWGLGRRCASFGSMLVAAAAFPIAARLLNEGRRAEAMTQLSANAAMLIGILAPTVVGLAVVGGPAAHLLIAEPYREMTASILGLSALAGALRFLHVHVTDQLFVLERRIANAAIVDVIEIVATLGFTVIGLLWHGPVGAVLGNAAGSLLATISSLVLASRMDFRLPLLDIAKVLAATTVMAAGLLLLPPPTGIPGLVLAIVAGMGLYAAAIGLAYAPLLRDKLGRRLLARRSAAAA